MTSGKSIELAWEKNVPELFRDSFYDILPWRRGRCAYMEVR